MNTEIHQNPDIFSNKINFIKGILIISIVLEHNTEMNSLVPVSKIILESYNVFGFFLIPFCFYSKPYSIKFIGERAFRYLIPFFWIVTFSSILFHFVINSSSFSVFFTNYLLGFIIMSPITIKASSGFYLFWFLPTLLILISIRSLWLYNSIFKFGLLIITLIFHLGLSSFLQPHGKYIPMGTAIAFYCFPVCLLFEVFVKNIITNIYAQSIAFVFFVFCLVIIGMREDIMFLYKMILPSIKQPFSLLIHDVCVLSSIPAMCFISSFFLPKIIVLFGKYSLGIFLFHQLLYHGIKRIFNFDPNWLSVSFYLFTTLASSLCFTMLLFRITKARRLFFPRDFSDWRLLLP